MSVAYDKLLELWGDDVVSRNAKQAQVRCPAHEDRVASLSIGIATKGDPGAVVHCQAGCQPELVMGAKNLPVAALYDSWWERRNGSGDANKIVATYDYVDEDGTLLFQVCRKADKRRGFPQRRPDGHGGWVWNLDGTRRVLYRLPQVIEAVKAGRRIWVVEGEEDVHALERADEVATCNPGGAGKWRDEFSHVLQGATVIVVADRDKPGRDHAHEVEGSLAGVAGRAVVCEPAEGKDARDHLRAGRGVDEFVRAEVRGEVEKRGEKWSGEGFSPLISTFPQGSLRFPGPLGEAAYCGPAGDIVREIGPHSEADPAAVLVSVLAMFGNAIGRGPYFRAGDADHATNLYVCIVGETSSGRKGTSAEGPRRLLTAADEAWRRCIKSGLVSGEGVIHHVRDSRSTRHSPRKGEVGDASDGLVEELVDPGVDDKRLMVIVPEFAQVLGAIARRDNTLSAVIRDLWDRGDAQTLAKNSPERTTGSLVSILAHVTPVELRSRLDSTEIGNGFANRFLFVASRRSKLLPRGGNIPDGSITGLSGSLSQALQHARRLTEVDMDPEAWQLWDGFYEHLTTPPPGLVGSITGRRRRSSGASRCSTR